MGNINTEFILISGMTEPLHCRVDLNVAGAKTSIGMILIRHYSNGLLSRCSLTGPKMSETSDWVRVVAYAGNAGCPD